MSPDVGVEIVVVAFFKQFPFLVNITAVVNVFFVANIVKEYVRAVG